MRVRVRVRGGGGDDESFVWVWVCSNIKTAFFMPFQYSSAKVFLLL